MQGASRAPASFVGAGANTCHTCTVISTQALTRWMLMLLLHLLDVFAAVRPSTIDTHRNTYQITEGSACGRERESELVVRTPTCNAPALSLEDEIVVAVVRVAGVAAAAPLLTSCCSLITSWNSPRRSTTALKPARDSNCKGQRRCQGTLGSWHQRQVMAH